MDPFNSTDHYRLNDQIQDDANTGYYRSRGYGYNVYDRGDATITTIDDGYYQTADYLVEPAVYAEPVQYAYTEPVQYSYAQPVGYAYGDAAQYGNVQYVDPAQYGTVQYSDAVQTRTPVRDNLQYNRGM